MVFKEGIRKLPIVIPIVMYQGKSSWTGERSLGGIIEGFDDIPEDIAVYIPNFSYLLYDLTCISDEEIKGRES